jgi:hypothetical protein
VAPWTGILLVAAAVVVAVVVLSSSGSPGNGSADNRPPAGAPEGTRIMSGANFGIAVPDSWTVGTDPGSLFAELQQNRWGEPRVAVNGTHDAAIVAVPLRRVAHDPLGDPELFWSDQLAGTDAGRTVSPARSIGIHGLSGTSITISDGSGVVIATAVKTEKGIYLLGFRDLDERSANHRFQRLVLTFDVR